MKAKKVLTLASELLSVRREIVAATNRHRQTVQLQSSERRVQAAKNLLVIAEAAAGVRALRPRPAPDTAAKIERNAKATLARIRAHAQVQAERHRQFQNAASQAALLRAAFIQQVQRDVPEELWQECIDSYDRAIFELGQENAT